jgi:hypothetical protein
MHRRINYRKKDKKTLTEKKEVKMNYLFLVTRNDTSNGAYYMPKASSSKTIFSN